MESTLRADQAPAPDIHEPAAAPRKVRPSIGLVAPLPAALRARRLLHEARAASLEHIEALRSAIGVVCDLASAVAEGDELYGPGLREFASRFTEDLFWKSKTLEMMAQRQRAQVDYRSDKT